MTTKPAHRKNAKLALASAEGYILDLIQELRDDGLLEHPEIAALADVAPAQAKALRNARINL